MARQTVRPAALIALLGVCALAAAAPATADTITIAFDGGGYTVRTAETTDDGTANRVAVSTDASGNLIVEDLGTGVDVVAGSNCSLLTIDRVSCPPDTTPSSLLDIAVGRGNDSVSLAGLAAAAGSKTPAGITTILVSGGEGADTIVGSAFDETLEGDGRRGNGTTPTASDLLANFLEGDDTLLGGAGLDVLRGDGGDDELNPGAVTPGVDARVNSSATRNVVDGGPGRDFLNGGTSLGPDLWIGGAGGDAPEISGRFAGVGGQGTTLANGQKTDVRGGDTVSFGTRTYTTSGTAGVVADLDGVADDGATGEADEIRADVEALEGTIRNDALTGSAGQNLLEGLAGVDTLTGGAAADRLFLRDGVADRCYTVTAGDVIDADLADPAPDACSPTTRVNRPSGLLTFQGQPVDETIPHVRIAAALRRATGGRLRIAVSCPASAKRACTGTLAIAATGRALASRRFRVRAGRTTTYTLRPSAAGRRALAKVRFARVIATQRGTSRKGPTTTLAFRRLPR